MWVDFPILNPYSSHMALPMWVQHGTMLQIPHESLMGCPYRTHINTHLWPMWVLYLLLAGIRGLNIFSRRSARMYKRDDFYGFCLPLCIYASTQPDLGLCYPHMPEDKFSHDVAHNVMTLLFFITVSRSSMKSRTIRMKVQWKLL